MRIEIRGANEHNLKDVDVELGDGLTVVTGVSGSGKTSLVFDTLYHEAHRRFLEIFGSSAPRQSPAQVRSIAGLGPAVAVGQNLLNRNPGSTLATASGLHPFLRLLYARFGERSCARCRAALSVLTEDEIVERLVTLSERGPVHVWAPMLRRVQGSHRTLLAHLAQTWGAAALQVDGASWSGEALDPASPHNLDVSLAFFSEPVVAGLARRAVEQAWYLGLSAVVLRPNRGADPHSDEPEVLSRAPVCTECGAWFGDLEPVHFHTPCPHCAGQGCDQCDRTGLYPQAAVVRWSGQRLTDLLAHPVDEVRDLVAGADLPSTADRLRIEIMRRLEALSRVGLGYVSLDRTAPTLSRGEAQRVRLAVALTSRLEDMLHVLDEPTIGQHPADVARLLPAFRDLLGPVVYVEHDRVAAAAADRAIDMGPGAGEEGGHIIFAGTPAELWQADTPTGSFFSLRKRVQPPHLRPAPERFLTLRGAHLRNLHDIDVPLPLGRLTVVTGVSGSGKSTLVEDVLAASLLAGEARGCRAIEGPPIKVVVVDQSPIGRNPRSNPATYTQLANLIRDLYAGATGLSPSHFSFNRPEGACPTCEGIGAVEVKMRYMDSTWIPCTDCAGQRFSDEVLAARVEFDGRSLSIADLFQLSIDQVSRLLASERRFSDRSRRQAQGILQALCDIGLGYLELGQPSPTLSGGEAQRVKLAKFLGQRSLAGNMLILDEPSTGLHPQDITGLLAVLDRLVRGGATVVVVEHNTDIIRAADWVVDLGPGAGPKGGRLLYAGPPDGLLQAADSLTGRALLEEAALVPRASSNPVRGHSYQASIAIRGAHAHNLRCVNVDLPKGKLTVVTGVSGSGKSSLVGDVLEAEARRRFLESLSLYERQSTREGPEAAVDAVTGLGVAVTITPTRRLYARRATVGTVTEIGHHLSVLLAWMGERRCLACGAHMERTFEAWRCPACGATATAAQPRHFNPNNYAAVCLTCNGVGTLRRPNPAKLIIHPEKPLCGGAMYSPGFFPKGYLCKPFNGGYDEVQAMAERYGFDPQTTPWNEMSPEAQQVFLFGTDEQLTYHYRSRTGRTYSRVGPFRGFFGWIGDWDMGGTYTDTQICPDCKGGRLRPEYAAVTLNGFNAQQLSEMPLADLASAMTGLQLSASLVQDLRHAHQAIQELAASSLQTVQRRLRFLCQVGLGYMHLNRGASTFSAGEAQRIALAGLLGSGLTSLTVLLDEPTRGLHPSEVNALLSVLSELRDEGNTVVVVEHDPEAIRAADHVIDMGPGAGAAGGAVVAQGSPAAVAQADTVTGRWLRGERQLVLPSRRPPADWLTIRGARANNLQNVDVRLPLGLLVGLCGVSGSGKSTLLIDTLGRALAPQKQTTSVAYEDVDPGEHEAIEGAPERVVLVDQSRRGLRSPASFLDLTQAIHALYAEGEDALALGLDEKALGASCSVCGGAGATRIEMGFLPDVWTPCETCQGTGYPPEVRDVRLRGLPLRDVFASTIDQVYTLFSDVERLAAPLQAARDVGLGYLVLRQPGYALSGGEAQRLKIAGELCRPGRGKTASTLYILDEPTVGQHLEDVARLTGVLQRLVDQGHSVIVIEHHPHLLAACDWLVELGPGGGPQGGQVIAAGTPESVAAGDTPTAPYLRQVLEGE